MLKWLTIDGVNHPVEDVLSGKIPTRYPMTYLRMAADFRKWDGKPHVTDLFNGARLTWLKNKADYAVNPEDASFRIFGTQAHGKLESHATEGMAEVGLELDDIQGTTDLICEINGERAMVDYKVVGSYKIQKALGIYQEDEPILEDGKPVLFKTGKNAGKPKTHKVIKTDPAKADMKDFTRQLNIYRYINKIMTGEDIENLYIFAIVRDGGTQIATQRGIVQNTYTFKIPYAKDEYVKRYIETRSGILREAMQSDVPPSLCSAEECWDGRRCKDYCEVSKACAALHDNPYLKEGTNDEEE